MGYPRTTLNKRQRERAKQEKREKKAERRAQRAVEKQNREVDTDEDDPDIADYMASFLEDEGYRVTSANRCSCSICGNPSASNEAI